MGMYYDFYVQQRDQNQWIVPVDFENRFDGFRAEYGYFVWFKHIPLFSGEDALFPLETTDPADIEQTAVFKNLEYGFREWFFGWIAFENLFFEMWTDTEVYMTGHVPAEKAWIFADGAQPFPEKQLVRNGFTETDIYGLLNHYHGDVRLTPVHPENYSGGKWITVSWSTTIAELVGDWRYSQFEKVKRLDKPENLRLICLYS